MTGEDDLARLAIANTELASSNLELRDALDDLRNVVAFLLGVPAEGAPGVVGFADPTGAVAGALEQANEVLGHEPKLERLNVSQMRIALRRRRGAGGGGP